MRLFSVVQSRIKDNLVVGLEIRQIISLQVILRCNSRRNFRHRRGNERALEDESHAINQGTSLVRIIHAVLGVDKGQRTGLETGLGHNGFRIGNIRVGKLRLEDLAGNRSQRTAVNRNVGERAFGVRELAQIDGSAGKGRLAAEPANGILIGKLIGAAVERSRALEAGKIVLFGEDNVFGREGAFALELSSVKLLGSQGSTGIDNVQIANRERSRLTPEGNRTVGNGEALGHRLKIVKIQGRVLVLRPGYIHVIKLDTGDRRRAGSIGSDIHRASNRDLGSTASQILISKRLQIDRQIARNVNVAVCGIGGNIQRTVVQNHGQIAIGLRHALKGGIRVLDGIIHMQRGAFLKHEVGLGRGNRHDVAIQGRSKGGIDAGSLGLTQPVVHELGIHAVGMTVRNAGNLEVRILVAELRNEGDVRIPVDRARTSEELKRHEGTGPDANGRAHDRGINIRETEGVHSRPRGHEAVLRELHDIHTKVRRHPNAVLSERHAHAGTEHPHVGVDVGLHLSQVVRIDFMIGRHVRERSRDIETSGEGLAAIDREAVALDVGRKTVVAVKVSTLRRESRAQTPNVVAHGQIGTERKTRRVGFIVVDPGRAREVAAFGLRVDPVNPEGTVALAGGGDMIEHRRLHLSPHALRFGQGTRIRSQGFHAVRRKGAGLVNQCIGEESYIPMHGSEILATVQKPVHLVDESVGLVLVEDVVGAYGHEDTLLVRSGFELLAVLVEHAYLEDFVRRSGVEPLHEIVVAPKKIVRHGDDGAVFCVQMLSAFAVEQGFTVELRLAEKQKSIRTEVHSALGVINRSYDERAALTEVKIGRKRKDSLAVLVTREVLERILKARLVVRERKRAARSNRNVRTNGAVLQALPCQDGILLNGDRARNQIKLIDIGIPAIEDFRLIAVARKKHQLRRAANGKRADGRFTVERRLAFVANHVSARDVERTLIAHNAVGIDTGIRERRAFVVVDLPERVHHDRARIHRRTRLVLHCGEIVHDKTARQVRRGAVFVDERLSLRLRIGRGRFGRTTEHRLAGNRQGARIRHLSGGQLTRHIGSRSRAEVQRTFTLQGGQGVDAVFYVHRGHAVKRHVGKRAFRGRQGFVTEVEIPVGKRQCAVGDDIGRRAFIRPHGHRHGGLSAHEDKCLAVLHSNAGCTLDTLEPYVLPEVSLCAEGQNRILVRQGLRCHNAVLDQIALGNQFIDVQDREVGVCCRTCIGSRALVATRTRKCKRRTRAKLGFEGFVDLLGVFRAVGYVRDR